MQTTELLDRTVSLLYPQRCLRCDDLVEYDDLFCESCPERIAEPIVLPFSHNMAGVASVYEYKGWGRKLVWAIKEGSPKRVRYILGYEMRNLLDERWNEVGFNAIVPVPVTESKLETQGFNHAELLAKPLSILMDIPIYPYALARSWNSLTQRDLGKVDRKENAELSYKAGLTNGLTGKTILLVDDLLTTGCTLAACADRLLDSGAAKVYGLTAAATLSR